MSIAIIGLGRWGKNLLKEFSKTLEISYCYTKGNPSNIKWLKKNYPTVKHTNSLNQIFQNDKITSVIIATPIKSHYQLSLIALKSGKNVFVEKPLATSIKQCMFLTKLAKKQNLTLFVGHIFLYHPVLLKIQKFIKNDPIIYLNCLWEKCGTFDEDIEYNLLSHQLLIMNVFLGNPKRFLLHKQPKGLPNKNLIQLDAFFSKNRQCHLTINRISNIKRMSNTIFTEKNIYLWENNQLFKFNKQNKVFKLIFTAKSTPLELECKAFDNSLKTKLKSYQNAEKALQTIKLLKQVKSS